jgi:guanylate kinase
VKENSRQQIKNKIQAFIAAFLEKDSDQYLKVQIQSRTGSKEDELFRKRLSRKKKTLDLKK